jgi:nucleotide-binding universal stress UspA family protein
MVLAVAGPTARQVSAIVTPLARARAATVHVLHVIETDVLAGQDTAELENPVQAQALVDGCVAELREAGVPVTGELLHSYGTHTDVATQILRKAVDLHAGAIVLGADTRHPILTTAVTAYITAHAPTHVIVINPNAGALGHPTPVIANTRDTPSTPGGTGGSPRS